MGVAHYVGIHPETNAPVHIWTQDRPKSIFIYSKNLRLDWKQGLKWRQCHPPTPELFFIETLEEAKNIWARYMRRHIIKDWRQEGF